MKKFLLLSLILLLVVGCSFKKESGKDSNNEKDANYSNYIGLNGTLDDVVEKKVTLNNKEHTLTFVYSYSVNDNDGQDGYYYVSVLLDNETISPDLISKVIADDDMEADGNINDFKTKFLDKVKEESLISDNDINVIKDSKENDVVTLNVKYISMYSGYYFTNLYYFNTSDMVDHIEEIDSNSWDLNDKEGNLVSARKYEISNDSITYYSCSKGKVVQYKATIENDKLNNTVLNTYQNNVNGYTISGGC